MKRKCWAEIPIGMLAKIAVVVAACGLRLCIFIERSLDDNIMNCTEFADHPIDQHLLCHHLTKQVLMIQCKAASVRHCSIGDHVQQIHGHELSFDNSTAVTGNRCNQQRDKSVLLLVRITKNAWIFLLLVKRVRLNKH